MTARQIQTPQAALGFMLAGRATVTLRSQRTGTHITYKIRAAKDGRAHFASVRVRPEGKGAFEYVALVTPEHQLRHTKGSTIHVEDPRYRALAFVLAALRKNEMPPACEIWHEGTCGRCGRKLTHPESIASGLGPECAGKTSPRAA